MTPSHISWWCYRYQQRYAKEPSGVVGLDIAGDEGSFPLRAASDPMAAATAEAARLGVPLTIHAGHLLFIHGQSR
jgi:hypothetical protein